MDEKFKVRIELSKNVNMAFVALALATLLMIFIAFGGNWISSLLNPWRILLLGGAVVAAIVVVGVLKMISASQPLEYEIVEDYDEKGPAVLAHLGRTTGIYLEYVKKIELVDSGRIGSLLKECKNAAERNRLGRFTPMTVESLALKTQTKPVVVMTADDGEGPVRHIFSPEEPEKFVATIKSRIGKK